MAARARWIVFRDQLRFHSAAEQAAILGEQADDDGLRAVVSELEAPNLVIEETVDADLQRPADREPLTLARRGQRTEAATRARSSA